MHLLECPEKMSRYTPPNISPVSIYFSPSPPLPPWFQLSVIVNYCNSGFPIGSCGENSSWGGSRTTVPDLMGLEDGPALVLSSSCDFDELDWELLLEIAFTYFLRFILYLLAPIILHVPVILVSEFPENVLFLLPEYCPHKLHLVTAIYPSESTSPSSPFPRKLS